MKNKSLNKLLLAVKPYKKLFVISILLGILVSVLNTIRPFIVQYIIDNPIKNKNIEQLNLYALILFAVILGHTFFLYLQRFLTGLLAQKVIHTLRVKVFEHILSLNLNFFTKTPVGILQTRTIGDIQTLENVFKNALISIIADSLQVIFVVAVMLYTSVKLTLWILIPLILVIIASWIFKIKVKKAFNEVREYVSRLNAFLQERISGIELIKTFQRKNYELQNFQKLNEALKQKHIKTIFYYSIFFPVIEFLSALSIALIIYKGGYFYLKNEITLGVIVAYIMYLRLLFRPIRILADQFNTLQLGFVCIDRISSILNVREKIENSVKPKNIILKKADIEFQNVKFAYKDNNWVLKGISFKVPMDTTLAIVGRTGAGKSTIFALLMRFYELQYGDIKINNTSIKEFALQDLRKNIGLVLQEPLMFNASLFENIRLFDESISREQVLRTIKELELEQFIEKFPEKLNHIVGERGNSLSVGEKQIVNLIRVSVHNPKILLFDEATANIDTHTEKLLQKALKKSTKNRTTLIIAHRLGTIKNADNIIVLKDGKIIEEGNHEKLLQKNGYYAKLYKLTFAI